MKKYNKLIIIIILAIITVLVFFDFIIIGFTNSDDSDTYIRALQGNFFSDADVWAKGQGRFYYYYRSILASVPYLIDNNIWLKCFQYIPILLNFLMFSIIIAKVFKSKKLGCAFYILLLLFFSIPKNAFMLPTAYPFIFSLDLLLFLLATYFLIKYYEFKKYFYYTLSLVCFAIPFYGYEAYFVLFILFLVVIITKNNPKFNLHLYLKPTSLKETLPLIITVTVFYILYFTFRSIINNSEFYKGSSFAGDFSLLNLFSFLFNINKSAFPTYFYFQSQDLIKFYNELHINSLFYIFTNSSYISLIKSLTLSGIFVYILSKISVDEFSYKKNIKLFFITIIVTYFFNIILGISEKYNSNYKLDGYCTTYFSFFGITFLFFIVFILLKKLTKKKIIYNYLFLSSIFIILFSISITISYSNFYLSKDWSISKKKFDLIDYMIENKDFENIPENSIIFSPDIYETKSILGKDLAGNGFSWRTYLKAKTGKSIYLCRNEVECGELIKNNSNAELYLLNKYEFPQKELYCTSISKIDKHSFAESQYSSNKLVLYIKYSTEINWTHNVFINNNWVYCTYISGNFIIPDFSKENIIVDYKQINSDFLQVTFIGKNILPDSQILTYDDMSISSGIICDAEKIDNKKNIFTTVNSKYIFDGVDNCVDSVSFSGKNSIKLNKNRPLGFTTIIKNVKKGNKYSITVKRLSEHNNGLLVIQTEDANLFYISENFSKKNIDSRWEEITINLEITEAINNMNLKVYCYNPHDNDVFFDDLLIKILEK